MADSVENILHTKMKKSSIAATTAPKPTRLATETTGRAEALAPASIVVLRQEEHLA
jgi:hypothetical protein